MVNTEKGSLIPQQRTITITWLLLVAMMLYALHLSGILAPPLFLVCALGLTLLKVVLVIWIYMDIRSAPLWLQGLCSAWVVLVMLIVSLAYLAPEQLANVRL